MELNKFGTAQYLMQDLITRSHQSEEFKKELISNPETTIEKVVGAEMRIPAGSRIIVEDQSNTDVLYLNIPRQVELDEVELTDEQLELVAGGDFGLTMTIIGGVVAICQAVDWIVEGYNNYP
ncbi:NHLP leader peptide family RiPP precursor [Lewinella sp. LCG006]|uniref:NHLP leader peptide family RiPP precursor n=1 Tax=Lewinella sp. LCG006 TaxID=3231911 RepID=UPI003460FCB6